MCERCEKLGKLCGKLHSTCNEDNNNKYDCTEGVIMQIETTKSEREREREEIVVRGETSFVTVCSWEICQFHSMKAQTNNKLSKISFEFTKFLLQV